MPYICCPFCGDALPNHQSECRVPGDLDRFERIHDLLDNRPEKSFLRQNLMRHLVSFGRRADIPPRMTSPFSLPPPSQPRVNSATMGA